MNIIELLKQYFLNRDERKKIKIERLEYMTNRKLDCEDCIHDGTDIKYYCDVCKVRHSFYLRLKKIQGENAGILKRLKSIVNKE